MFVLWEVNIYWELSLQWASNKLWWLLFKHSLDNMFFCESWVGDGSFCHFNSFVNVFMNAINTSFTLLCFWIPLGCGLCQFLSPRRQPASHNTSLSCVAEHWQTQFTKGKTELTPCCGSCPDGNKWLIPFQGGAHLLCKASLHTRVGETRRDKGVDKPSWLTQSNTTAGQGMLRTNSLKRKACSCRHHRLLPPLSHTWWGLAR